MRSNCTLFTRQYVACQARPGNLDSFFDHENLACLPSLSDMGQLRHGSKSYLIECLEKYSPTTHNAQVIDVKVFDGAAIIHIDLAEDVFLPYITSQL